ncbi:MAG: DivIVA domain-containing protein [Eubacteriales bacterium]
MMLPAELKKKEFSKVIKGYSSAEVDEYISYLLAKYNEAYRDYTELEKKYKNTLIQLEEAKNDESTFSALVLDARKMADAIVRDANAKAKAITDAVSESCNKILDAYKESVIAERDKLAKTEKLALQFKESLYTAYREHIDAIDKILPDEPEEDKGLSAVGDEELVDSALDLARQKYNEGAEDIELAPIHADKEPADGE